jgi:hypothetical protein
MANIGGREPYLPVKVTWNLSWNYRNVENIIVTCTKYEIRWKYTRNRPSKLGEIRNSDTITTYFTERSEVYFYGISTVFLSNYFTKRSEVYFYGISTVFLSNYFTEPSAAGRRSEVYFYGISTVFLSNYFTERSEVYFYPISIVLRTSYLVLSTLYNSLFL